MEDQGFNAKSALASIKADKKPKRGRKKGKKTAANITTYDTEVDPERLALIKETVDIYNREGYGWLIEENPREKYTTEQLRLHVQRLRKGHRPWIFKGEWSRP